MASVQELLQQAQPVLNPDGAVAAPAAGGEDEGHNRTTIPPKKRAIAFTAFAICLGFLLYIADLCTSFILKLVESEKAWTNYETYMEKKCPSTTVSPSNPITRE